MRIAVFSDSLNIPPKEGINVHTYELLNELATRTDVTPILIVCDRGWLNLRTLREQRFETILVPEKYFYDVRFVAETLERYQIDIAQSYMTYFSAVILGPAAYNVGVPMVAEFHDLEESIVPLYFKGDELDDALRVHQLFQRQAADYASLVRMVSSYDLDIVKQQWNELSIDKYFWLPVSRACSNIVQASQPADVLYIGNMSYAPNAEGAAIICNTLAKHMDGRDITFIGRGSDKYMTHGIRALGPVDDIIPYLKTTAVGLSPIVSGSGIKIKNLTYLSNGIPCISTSFGANSFPPCEAIIIEDDIQKWPALISRIIGDHPYRRHLSRVAQRYFREHFDIRTNTDILLSRYQAAIDAYLSTKISLRPHPHDQSVDMRHVYWLRELRESGEKPVDRPLHIIPNAREVRAPAVAAS